MLNNALHILPKATAKATLLFGGWSLFQHAAQAITIIPPSATRAEHTLAIEIQYLPLVQ